MTQQQLELFPPGTRIAGLYGMAHMMLANELYAPHPNEGIQTADSGFNDDTIAGQEFEAARNDCEGEWEG